MNFFSIQLSERFKQTEESVKSSSLCLAIFFLSERSPGLDQIMVTLKLGVARSENILLSERE